MLELLNDVVGLFGKASDWNYTATLTCLIIAQVIVTAALVLSVLYLIKRVKAAKAAAVADTMAQQTAQDPTIIYVNGPQAEVERMLTSISLDLAGVQKEYTVGDAINHEGLVVTAHYNKEPLTQQVTDYAVLSPDMSKPGKPTVTVSYQDRTVGYQIVVNPASDEATTATRNPVIVEEESFESRLRYDKSFVARMIQSDDEVKLWYTDLKNTLLSYDDVKDRMSWKYETFKSHKDLVAKLAYRGKTLCIFLPLNPADYTDESTIEDASDTALYADTPLMLRLKSGKRVKLAKQLIETVMDQKRIKKIQREAVDYYLPYEGLLELINKGLVKREVRTAQDEAIFDKNKSVEDIDDDDTADLTEVGPGVYVTKKS